MKECGKARAIRNAVILSSLLAFAPLAQAQLVNLVDQNSVVQIQTSGSGAGMFNWLVDGQDYLAQQWFWFRVGSSGPESRIDTISAPTITTPDARSLYVSYFNGSFGVEVDYRLTGFSPGSGLSHVDEVITITNATATPLAFHLFQYSDFDLGPGADFVTLNKNIFGQFKGALQTNGPSRLAESVVTPGADHGEAAVFPFTLNRLNDGVATTLNDTTSAGPGDVTWGFEWDQWSGTNGFIDPFSSDGISKIKDLSVPEPAVAVLIPIGAAVLAWRRRNQTKQ